ncbi:MAG: hypothetical protein ACRDRP_06950 [Pseudonocardiaceae bacterium]
MTWRFRPEVNIRVGLGIFSGHLRADGMRTAYRKYNGPGPAFSGLSGVIRRWKPR